MKSAKLYKILNSSYYILYETNNEYKNIYNVLNKQNQNIKTEQIKRQNIKLEKEKNTLMEESLKEYYNQLNNIKD